MSKIVVLLLILLSNIYAGLFELGSSNIPLSRNYYTDASISSLGFVSTNLSYDGNINGNPALYANNSYLTFKFNFNSAINSENVAGVSNTNSSLSNSSLGINIPIGFLGDIYFGNVAYMSNKFSISDTLNNQEYSLVGAVSKLYFGYAKNIKFLSLGLSLNKYIGSYDEMYTKTFDGWTPIVRKEATVDYKYKDIDNFTTGISFDNGKISVGGYAEMPITLKYKLKRSSGSMNYSDALNYTKYDSTNFIDSIPLNIYAGVSYKMGVNRFGINGGGEVKEGSENYLANLFYIKDNIFGKSPLIVSTSYKRASNLKSYRFSIGSQLLLKKDSGRFDFNIGLDYSKNGSDNVKKIFLNIGAVVFNRWGQL